MTKTKELLVSLSILAAIATAYFTIVAFVL